MKSIDSIDLVLENCEVIQIHEDYIGSFNLGNLNTEIKRVAVNSIRNFTSAKDTFIEIYPDANDFKHFLTRWSDENVPPFSRLTQHDDIAAIVINYKDGSEEHVYVDWDEGNECYNTNQTSIIDEETGNFYLVISEKETVNSYFSSISK